MIGPEQGLADIKALGDFFPESWGPAAVIGAVIVVLLIAVIKYLNQLQRSNPEATNYQRVKASIAEANDRFRSGKITEQDYLSELSLRVREYLQGRLKFPAAGMTAHEASLQLEGRDTNLINLGSLIVNCESQAFVPRLEKAAELTQDKLLPGNRALSLIEAAEKVFAAEEKLAAERARQTKKSEVPRASV